MQKNHKKILFILSLFVICIGSALILTSFWRSSSEENVFIEKNENIGLEEKMQEALDPNTYYNTDACVIGRQIPVNGYISKKTPDYIYVKPGTGDDLEQKVKLTPKTLFVKIKITSESKVISEEEILWNDFQDGDSVAVNAFCEQENPDQLIALVVKIIFFLD